MNRLLIFILSLLLPGIATAKGDVLDSMNSDAFWKTISFTDYRDLRAAGNSVRIPEAETMIVVASNRMPHWEKVRFMGEERANDHLTYFVAFQKDGTWHLWRTSLKAAIASMKYPDRDWVVYTEGYGKVFTNGLYRGLSMAAQHQVNVLYLDYPSYTTAKKVLGNYYFAMDNAKLAGDDFAPVLDTVKRLREANKMGKGHLTLFFHSMGNNALREIVRTNRLKEMNDYVWVDNLVLNSACVPESDHTVWLDRIRFAKRIYVNYNPKDVTLGGAALVSLTRQLGQGPRVNTSRKAVYVNFNTLCDRNHSNFINLAGRAPAPPGAIAYYTIVLHGNMAPVENRQLFAGSSFHGVGYDLICNNAETMANCCRPAVHLNDAAAAPSAKQSELNTGADQEPAAQRQSSMAAPH